MSKTTRAALIVLAALFGAGIAAYAAEARKRKTAPVTLKSGKVYSVDLAYQNAGF